MFNFDQPIAGRAVRAFREKRGLKGKDFCAKTGISPSHLSEIENGHKNLTERLADKILSGFHLTADQLSVELCELGRSDDKPDTPSPVVMDDSPQYVIKNDGYKDLAIILVSEMEQEKAWQMVRDLTIKAQSGEIKSARSASALIDILSSQIDRQ